MRLVERALIALLVGISLGSARTAAGQATVIHNFGPTVPGPDGAAPVADLVIDPKGDLFGTTLSSGTYGYGTAF